MAGATIAAFLAPRGIKIALIDRSFSEKSRIVGELLQPGAVVTLEKMGLGHLLEGFDAQKVKGYALFQGENEITVPYNRDQHTDYHGMGLHNGRFLQKIRACALQNETVTQFEGKATELIEDENQVVSGIKFKAKDGNQHVIRAKLTITSDGFFSNFRKNLSKNKKKVTSFFIGLLLKDCALPYPGYGHVFLSGPTPFICYPVSTDEVRVLVDFPGDKPPKREAIMHHLQHNVSPFIPSKMREQYELVVQAQNFKIMPNHYMAAKPILKEGAVLLGDSLNMRHPLTGGGITAVFSDVYLLGSHLMAMRDFSDKNLINEKVERYYRDRQPANANVNILANALYGVMSNDLLKEAVFKYISKGGDCAQEPISLLAGLNKSHKTLIKQFFSVAYCGVTGLLRENLRNVPAAFRVVWDALIIIKPLIKNELLLASFYFYRPGKINSISVPERETERSLRTTISPSK